MTINNACCYTELIDTCWDVNHETLTESDYNDYELIDTCWDVNL